VGRAKHCLKVPTRRLKPGCDGEHVFASCCCHAAFWVHGSALGPNDLDVTVLISSEVFARCMSILFIVCSVSD
jgi:hypothetical protein